MKYAFIFLIRPITLKSWTYSQDFLLAYIYIVYFSNRIMQVEVFEQVSMQLWQCWRAMCICQHTIVETDIKNYASFMPTWLQFYILVHLIPMCVSVWRCVCVWVCECVCECVYVYVHVCANICICQCIHACVGICVCSCTCSYVCASDGHRNYSQREIGTLLSLMGKFHVKYLFIILSIKTICTHSCI